MSPANASYQEDLDLFLELESLYHALKLSVQDPIVVPNPKVKPGTVVFAEGFPLEISRRYFYAEDGGLEIVRGRIEKKSEEIRKAYAKHTEMSVIFSCIDANAADGKHFDVARNILQLCECLLDYGKFIHNHRRYSQETEIFLHFPYYIGGNISCRADASFAAYLLPFNPQGNEAGFHASIRYISSLVTSFSAKVEHNLELNLNSVYTGNEPDSYEASLYLTKILLKEHLDFDVEEKGSPN